MEYICSSNLYYENNKNINVPYGFVDAWIMRPQEGNGY